MIVQHGRIRGAEPAVPSAVGYRNRRRWQRCWLYDRGRVIGFLLGKTGDGGRVMYRAVVIGANSDGLSGVASKDDQCGFGVGT